MSWCTRTLAPGQGTLSSERWITELRRPARVSAAVGDIHEAGVEPAEPDNPRPSARCAGKVWRGDSPMSPTCWKMLPGPAGFAPASRRRPPTRSGPRRALGFVQRRRALSNAAELRDPVARGLAHARQIRQLNCTGRAGEKTTTLPWCWMYLLPLLRFSLPSRRRIVAEATCRPVRGTGLEPAPRGSRPLVPIHLHHPLR